MTHDDICNEPGAQRIAHRSTQANDPLRLKRHWTELEVWFRPNAGDRPPFVAVVLGCTSVDGQTKRETVTEAATLRLALSYIGEGAPATFVRQQAQSWMARYEDAPAPFYTEAQRNAALAVLANVDPSDFDWPEQAIDEIAEALGLRRAALEPARAFDKIAAGLEDARRFADGDTSRGRVHHG